MNGPAGFLTRMLQVLDDEELLVLSPEPRVGFRVRIRGIGDNFQLHTLLAGSIIGPAVVLGYPAIFAAVDALGYTGWVGCEYRPRGDTDAGLKWLRALSQ